MNFFDLRPPYKTFWILLIFGGLWGNFCVLKFSKMSILIFFNLNHILLYELFSFEASLYDFLNFVDFLWGWIWGYFWVFQFSKMSILIFFNFNDSLIYELFWFEASLYEILICWLFLQGHLRSILSFFNFRKSQS